MNQQTNPFQQPKKKTSIGKIILYIFLSVILISVLSAIFSDDKTQTSSTAIQKNEPVVDNSAQNDALVDNISKEEKEVIEKLKARAAKDWPDDFTTQEYWINKQIEDYRYMLTIEDNSIKKKAQRDWPLDFTTQKFWYDQQIEAKQRVSKQ